MSVGDLLNKFITGIKSAFSNNKLAIGICFVVFIVIGIVYYYKIVYPKYINKDYVDNREFIPKDSKSNEATLYFFYTDWCPHCKKASPVIMKLKEYIESKGGAINGVKVNVIDINCENDTKTADKFNVDGYPTIKLAYKGKVIEYDAKPQMDTLIQFLEASLK